MNLKNIVKQFLYYSRNPQDSMTNFTETEHFNDIFQYPMRLSQKQNKWLHSIKEANL